jgi:hypothetical protein
MHACVCVCVCMHACVCVCMQAFLRVWTCVCAWVYENVHKCVCVGVRADMCVHVHVCTFVCVHVLVCMSVCYVRVGLREGGVHVYKYICMQTCYWAQDKILLVFSLPTDSPKCPYSPHLICQFQIIIILFFMSHQNAPKKLIQSYFITFSYTFC